MWQEYGHFPVIATKAGLWSYLLIIENTLNFYYPAILVVLERCVRLFYLFELDGPRC